jgi:hypothetical protein
MKKRRTEEIEIGKWEGNLDNREDKIATKE